MQLLISEYYFIKHIIQNNVVLNFLRKIAAEEIKQAWRRRQARLRNPNATIRKFEFLPKLFDSEATDYSKMIPFEKLSSNAVNIAC